MKFINSRVPSVRRGRCEVVRYLKVTTMSRFLLTYTEVKNNLSPKRLHGFDITYTII
jgi:hypothetical protein